MMGSPDPSPIRNDSNNSSPVPFTLRDTAMTGLSLDKDKNPLDSNDFTPGTHGKNMTRQNGQDDEDGQVIILDSSEEYNPNDQGNPNEEVVEFDTEKDLGNKSGAKSGKGSNRNS